MATSKLEIVISATDKASGVIHGIDTAFGTLAKVAGGLVVGGLAAAAAGVAALGKGLIDLAQDAAVLLPIKQAFEGINAAAVEAESSMFDKFMLKNADSINLVVKSANEMMKALRESSKGMVTDTDLMKSFNLAAQLVGIEFAQKLPEAMGYLQKVAGATGQSMSYMMESLVRGVGRLSPLILDNLGISINLTDAYKAYGDSIGIVVKESTDLTKSQQQAAVMMEVMRQLAINTAAMPDVSNPFQKLAVTFQNLKDQAALSIGATVLPVIQRLAETLSSFVASDAFQSWLASIASWLNVNLVPALMSFVGWLQGQLPAAMQTFSTFLNTQLLPGLTNLWNWLQTQLPVAIQTLMSYWAQLQPAFQSIGVFLAESLIPFLGELSAWFTNSFVPALATVEEWLNKQTAAQERLSASVRENVWPIFQQLWGWIKTNVIPTAQQVWQQLKNWQTAFDNVKIRIIALLTQLRIMIERLKQIKLPSWLRPGSPTPFELGLVGIINQIDTLAGQSIPRLTNAFSAMDRPMPTTGLSSLATGGGPLSSLQTAGAAGLGGASGVTVVYSPVFSAASMHEFEQNLVPLIDRQLTLNQRRRV